MKMGVPARHREPARSGEAGGSPGQGKTLFLCGLCAGGTGLCARLKKSSRNPPSADIRDPDQDNPVSVWCLVSTA